VFLEQLINGITLGSIYAIVALGYTLVFGVLDIINMAHGEIFMFGAFVGMLIVSKAGAPLPVAFLGAIIVTAAMGLLLEGTSQIQQGRVAKQDGSVRAVFGRMRDWFQRNF